MPAAWACVCGTCNGRAAVNLDVGFCDVCVPKARCCGEVKPSMSDCLEFSL